MTITELVPAFLAAVGTVAPDDLSAQFRSHLDARGVTCAPYSRFTSLDDLEKDTSWRLAMVLSPFKQAALGLCNEISHEAASIGAVDTLIRAGNGSRIGVNTNVHALHEAIQSILANSILERVLILGSGGTARCAGYVFSTHFPQSLPYVWARSPERRDELVKRFRLRAIDKVDRHRWDLVINCTTVGETQDDTSVLPLAGALSKGTRLLDLNNRVSSLQTHALSVGAIVMSGVSMQDSVHRLRASLLQPTHSAAPLQER